MGVVTALMSSLTTPDFETATVVARNPAVGDSDAYTSASCLVVMVGVDTAVASVSSCTFREDEAVKAGAACVEVIEVGIDAFNAGKNDGASTVGPVVNKTELDAVAIGATARDTG